MIVFFDGVCNLCQSSVSYLFKNDKIFEIKNYILDNLNNFVLYNINQNSLINAINEKLGHE